MTMPSATRLLSPRNDSGLGLEVDFFWSGDRYQHSLYRRLGDERTPLIESLADDPERGVALVELHPQLSTAPHPTLFLHGAGGGAQWSMSVEAAVAGELRFDVAARVVTPPLQRKLVYTRFDSGDSVGLECEVDTEMVERPAGELELVASHSPEAIPPVTLRWQYRFRLAPQ